MKTFHGIKNYVQACELFRAHGIQFDFTGSTALAPRPYLPEQPKDMREVIVYFLRYDKTDVGYFLPIVGAVVMHDAPRKWNDAFWLDVRAVISTEFGVNER